MNWKYFLRTLLVPWVLETVELFYKPTRNFKHFEPLHGFSWVYFWFHFKEHEWFIYNLSEKQCSITYKAHFTKNSTTWESYSHFYKIGYSGLVKKDGEFVSEQLAEWPVTSKKDIFYSCYTGYYLPDLNLVHFIWTTEILKWLLHFPKG